MRVRQSDIPNTDFRTHYGHYKFLDISFGLTNAPSTLMDLMNNVLKPYLDMCVILFIDEDVICSWDEEDHANNLIVVLQTPRNRELYAKISKCEFC